MGRSTLVKKKLTQRKKDKEEQLPIKKHKLEMARDRIKPIDAENNFVLENPIEVSQLDMDLFK